MAGSLAPARSPLRSAPWFPLAGCSWIKKGNVPSYHAMYPILPYPILPSPTLRYPILSYATLSYPTLPYPILSYPVTFTAAPLTPAHPRPPRPRRQGTVVATTLRKTGANTQEAREVLSMGPGQYFGERHLLGASVRPVSGQGRAQPRRGRPGGRPRRAVSGRGRGAGALALLRRPRKKRAGLLGVTASMTP
jgi:hypothetical protein